MHSICKNCIYTDWTATIVQTSLLFVWTMYM